MNLKPGDAVKITEVELNGIGLGEIITLQDQDSDGDWWGKNANGIRVCVFNNRKSDSFKFEKVESFTCTREQKMKDSFNVGDLVEISESERPSLILGDLLTLTRCDEDGDWWASRGGDSDYCIGQNYIDDSVKFKKATLGKPLKEEMKKKAGKSEDDLRDDIKSLMRQLSDANKKAVVYESAFRELSAYIDGFFQSNENHPTRCFAVNLKSRLNLL
jgi:hypothetical protein